MLIIYTGVVTAEKNIRFLNPKGVSLIWFVRVRDHAILQTVGLVLEVVLAKLLHHSYPTLLLKSRV